MATQESSPPQTSSEFLRLEFEPQGVATLYLSNPRKRNALKNVMLADFCAELGKLDQDDRVRVLVLKGDGGAFCAGVDIKELKELDTVKAAETNFLQNLEDALQSFSKPVIAAVEGLALGGGFEIALACDMIYTDADAKFGLPEVKIGTIPGGGGTQRLVRALGRHKASELIFTGDFITGQELEKYGLAKSVPKDNATNVLDEALAVARKIAAHSGPTVQTVKRAVKLAEENHLTDGNAKEKTLYYSTFSTPDFQEGTNAFVEKRAPKWVRD